MTRPIASQRPSKRLVVLSDGTWHTLETKVATNVRAIAKAVEHHDESGIPQLVFYDAGVGTTGGLADKYIGGMTGAGIDKNIKELYTFLSLNYEEGDEIYLFGFSRGAYTVRSLVGLIYESGLVRRPRIEFIHEAYELYRRDVDPDGDESRAFRRENGDRVPIKLLGCFDTVAALGMPISIFSKLTGRNYSFHNPTVNGNVENAVHCLSIDETRSAYAPTLMHANERVGAAQLTQRWFWGTHSGVGGGCVIEPEAARVTLRFMVDEMARRGLGLRLDEGLLPSDVDVAARTLKGAPGWIESVQNIVGTAARKIDDVADVHPDAIRRYQAVQSWRPMALSALQKQLMKVQCS